MCERERHPMKDSLETTLRKLAEALEPYRGRVEMTASTPYGGARWLRVSVEAVEHLAAARKAAEEIIAAAQEQLGLTVYAPLDGRVLYSIWNQIGYFEGFGLLEDYLSAIAEHLPPDAPRDINGFGLHLKDFSTDAVFSMRTSTEATQADYARDDAVRGRTRDVSFVRVRVSEWFANRTWKSDYLYRLEEYAPWERWTQHAEELVQRVFDQHDEVPSLYFEWMVALCADAIRSALPKFLALPNVTDDFIAFVNQYDVDEHTHLLDLSRTLGFKRAAELFPLVPLARLQ
jgi:hypothetical protein